MGVLVPRRRQEIAEAIQPLLVERMKDRVADEMVVPQERLRQIDEQLVEVFTPIFLISTLELATQTLGLLSRACLSGQLQTLAVAQRDRP